MMKTAPFLTSPPIHLFLFLPELPTPHPHILLLHPPQRNLNLIMTLHVAVLALTPSSVAYLSLASDGKSCDFVASFLSSLSESE